MQHGILLVSNHYQIYSNECYLFSCLDFVLGRAFDDHGDMSKARKYGWTTTVNTVESYVRCFDRLKEMEIIPSI